MKTLRKLPYLALLSILFFWIPTANSEVVKIDFEDQDVKMSSQLVIHTPKVTVNISRSGINFNVVNLNEGNFGQRSLAPEGAPSTEPFVAEFSVPVSAVTVEFGDYGTDFFPEVDTAFVWAYSETGDLLQTKNVMCCGEQGSGFSSGSITIESAGIKWIKFHGGSFAAPDSLFYDNIVLTLEKNVIDTDNDGVADDVDTCINSDLSPTVVIEGCVTEVPNTIWESGCTTTDYFMACSNNARNHGDFVNCAKDFSESLKKIGSITDNQQSDLHTCSAQASLP